MRGRAHTGLVLAIAGAGFFLSLFALWALSPAEPAQADSPCTITWDGSTSGGDWGTATNWDQNRVPTTGDVVCITTVTGTVTYSGGNTSIAELRSSAALAIQGGELELTDTAALLNNVDGFSLSGGQFGDSGTPQGSITDFGDFSWTAGSFEAPSAQSPQPTFTMESGGNATIASPQDLNGWTLSIGSPLAMSGTVNFLNGGGITESDVATLADGTTVTDGGSAGPFAVTSSGTLIPTPGGTATFGVPVTNAGTAGPGSGTLILDSLSNTGTLDLSTGLATIASDYSPGSSSTLAVTIDGASPGAGYGQLQVTGTTTLAGTLNITTSPSFVPTLGQTFAITTSTSSTGSFTTTVQPITPSGLIYYKAYGATGVTLTAGDPITPPTLPTMTQNTAFSAALAVHGGTSPYTWSISAGTLPAGLSINTSTGLISGTPTSSGPYSFTVQVTDSAIPTGTATRAYTGTVLAQPTLTTTASGPSVPGSLITDTGVLSGGNAPTGTINFTLYGPNNGTCTGSPIFTTSASVSGNGSYLSPGFTATSAGSYNWRASYSGDSNNAAVALLACGSTGETTTVAQATPTLTTAASGPVLAGSLITDTATLSGGSSPSGTINFEVFGPNNATCTGSPVFTTAVTVTGNGAYLSAGYSTTGAGSYNWRASYSGDTANAAVPLLACGATGETSTATQMTPTMPTSASGPVVVGALITDTATLSGGSSPTGTITFNLYGPNNATCTGSPAFTTGVTVTGNKAYVSPGYSAVAGGTYRWVASYSGDIANAPVNGVCGASGETSTVNFVTPTMPTTASGPATVGALITDTATLSGGSSPTGTITFNLYGPNNATCTGSPIFTNGVTVTGNKAYVSAGFSTASAGSYNWVASYSGDAANAPVNGVCGATNETSTVAQTVPTMPTAASGPAAVGALITDTATLSGGSSPTGTITFNLYGPNNATCTGSPIFTTGVTVSGNKAYLSAGFSTSTAGSYNWVASYSGDSANAPVNGVCGATGETSTVAQTVPTMTTTALTGVTAGDLITDTATLAGGQSPTGTITFMLYGPSNIATCTAPIFTTGVTVTGNKDYVSSGYSTTAAGSYYWVASYGGDSSNAPINGTCGTPGETSTAKQVVPTLTTTASGPVAAGGLITDTATLAGGESPTGTIDFFAYGPSDPSCSSSPVFSTASNVSGNGNYTSAAFSTSDAGTYNWRVSYSGNLANAPVALSACGSPGEESIANAIAQSIAFTSSPPTAVVGGAAYNVSATATSKLPVSFSSGSPGVCSVAGSSVSFNALGTCTVLADQAGNSVFAAAPTASQSFSVVGSGGYDMVGSDGGVFVFPTGQSAGFFGSLPGLGVKVNNVVGIVPTSDDQGYFLVGSDGGVFAFGDAPFENSLPGIGVKVNNIVGIVPTSNDQGYFLVGSDGGVFTFGSAPFLGSLPGIGVNTNSIIGIAANPSDTGYWLVAANGAVYSFGTAANYGSAPSTSSPVSAIQSTLDGLGYWIVTENGGVYAFGDAQNLGSLPALGVNPTKPVIGLVPTDADTGYWLIGSDGGLFAFGNAPFVGSLPGLGVSVNNIVGAVPT